MKYLRGTFGTITGDYNFIMRHKTAYHDRDNTKKQTKQQVFLCEQPVRQQMFRIISNQKEKDVVRSNKRQVIAKVLRLPKDKKEYHRENSEKYNAQSDEIKILIRTQGTG